MYKQGNKKFYNSIKEHFNVKKKKKKKKRRKKSRKNLSVAGIRTSDLWTEYQFRYRLD
jgi:hypothetical protein